MATDVAVFSLRDKRLVLLCIKRKHGAFKGFWALPGGFVQENETLDQCAARELAEEAGVRNAYLHHFSNFSEPRRDPRERVISVAYLALIESSDIQLKADTDATDAVWFSLGELPELAFDHAEIVRAALASLRRLVDDGPIALELMPDEFTLADLQAVHEAILDKQIDKRNFRRKILGLDIIEEAGEVRGAHRPAQTYRRTAGSEFMSAGEGASMIEQIANGEERPFRDFYWDDLLRQAKAEWDDRYNLYAVCAEAAIRCAKNPASKARNVLDEVFPRLKDLIEVVFPPEPDAKPGNSAIDDKDWPKIGLLKAMGYSVGKANGLTNSARQNILQQVFFGPIKNVDSSEYMAQWGKDGTVQRLHKLAWSIATFANNRLRANGGEVDESISQWMADLEWLRETFYRGHFGFPWPPLTIKK